jgi:Protein of unknown function (DUF2867)
MMVREAEVAPSARAIVANANFADAFEVVLQGPLTAMEVAYAMVGATPTWIKSLMKLRDALVGRLGLKTENGALAPGPQSVGFFPIISVAPNRAVLGVDDRHLDFRLVVDTKPFGNGLTRVVVSTVLKRHNIWGRIYLAIVLPFHKIIVPAMMKRIRT